MTVGISGSSVEYCSSSLATSSSSSVLLTIIFPKTTCSNCGRKNESTALSVITTVPAGRPVFSDNRQNYSRIKHQYHHDCQYQFVSLFPLFNALVFAVLCWFILTDVLVSLAPFLPIHKVSYLFKVFLFCLFFPLQEFFVKWVSIVSFQFGDIFLFFPLMGFLSES